MLSPIFTSNSFRSFLSCPPYPFRCLHCHTEAAILLVAIYANRDRQCFPLADSHCTQMPPLHRTIPSLSFVTRPCGQKTPPTVKSRRFLHFRNLKHRNLSWLILRQSVPMQVRESSRDPSPALRRTAHRHRERSDGRRVVPSAAEPSRSTGAMGKSGIARSDSISCSAASCFSRKWSARGTTERCNRRSLARLPPLPLCDSNTT